MSVNESRATLEQPVQTVKRLYTYDELVAEFPESNQPCELWDGEIFSYSSPSFDHQQIVMRVARQLYDWASAHNAGEVVHGPIDMVLSPHLVTQPDAVFIACHRLGIIERAIRGPADLAVEVMSLGHRNRDRIQKRDLYEQYGLKEYWLVDPEAQTVEVLHLENARYRLLMRATVGARISSKLLPGFELSVNAVLFGE